MYSFAGLGIYFFLEAFYNITVEDQQSKFEKAYAREKLQRKSKGGEMVPNLQAVFGCIAFHTKRKDNNTSTASAGKMHGFHYHSDLLHKINI